jgi:hypothetical protein
MRERPNEDTFGRSFSVANGGAARRGFGAIRGAPSSNGTYGTHGTYVYRPISHIGLIAPIRAKPLQRCPPSF